MSGSIGMLIVQSCWYSTSEKIVNIFELLKFGKLVSLLIPALVLLLLIPTPPVPGRTSTNSCHNPYCHTAYCILLPPATIATTTTTTTTTTTATFYFSLPPLPWPRLSKNEPVWWFPLRLALFLLTVEYTPTKALITTSKSSSRTLSTLV